MSFLSPTLTLLNAIANNQLLGIPDLTAEAGKKHFVLMIATD